MGTFITVLVPGLRMGGGTQSSPNPPVAMSDVYRPSQSVAGRYSASGSIGGTSRTTQSVGGKTGGGGP